MKAIQLSNKRVGSTFLQNCINSHPDLKGIDEVFVKHPKKDVPRSGFTPYVFAGKSFEDYIKEVYSCGENVIFKLMYDQIEFHSGLAEYIKKSNIPMIHLIRRNLLRQCISNYVGSKRAAKVTKDIIIKDMDKKDKENKKFAEEYKDQIKLTLYYEDIVGTKVGERTYMEYNLSAEVCRLFDVEVMPLYSLTKKLNNKGIRDYISCADELEKAIKKEWKWFLKEE